MSISSLSSNSGLILIAAYGLTGVPDISRISEDTIWQLYQQGRASVFCDVYDHLRVRYVKRPKGKGFLFSDNLQRLWVQDEKEDNTVIAIDADDDTITYPVTRQLVTIADFVSYSKELFDKSNAQ